MRTATANSAAAVASIMRKALAQDEHTPDAERLSFRVLVEEALPLLEYLAEKEEAAS